MKMNISFENYGDVIVELNETIAPNHIRAMKRLADMGKYNNKRIERLEPGFVIQPLFFDGTDEELDKMIDFEISDIKFEKYVVATASDGKLSCTGQFFIMLGRSERLDNKFTVVGKVIEGFDVVDSIGESEVLEGIEECFKYHYPKNDIVVKNIKIE